MTARTAVRVAVLALTAVSSLGGCSAPSSPGPGAPDLTTATQDMAAPRPRTDIETALDCYLTGNTNYSAGKGTSERAAVAELKGWYPPITRMIRWPRAADSSTLGQDASEPSPTPEPSPTAEPTPGAGPTTWLLYAQDGRGYGTATVDRPDPTIEEWSAAVDRLCVAVVPPAPSNLTDLTVDGRSHSESLADPANAGFVTAMTTAIVGLPEGDAADALTAVGWRVRVGERDGVRQETLGSAPTWINLVVAAGVVTGFSIG